jgi:CRISPR-associated protein Cas5t
VGARVTVTLLNRPPTSVVLRTVWRLKKPTLGSGGNTRPDYQQLLTEIEMIVWLDSSKEQAGHPFLEDRVRQALDPSARRRVNRFGGISLGESTHLVDSVCLLTDALRQELEHRSDLAGVKPRTYLQAEQGLLGLPVWVDHVGSSGTVHVVGDLFETPGIDPPPVERMPQIRPRESNA